MEPLGSKRLDLNPQAEAAMKKLRLVSLTAGIVLGVALAASAGQPAAAQSSLQHFMVSIPTYH